MEYMMVKNQALQIKQYYLNNEQELNYILHQDTKLAEAILCDDD